MRYPRTKPPIVLAIVAALAVASPFCGHLLRSRSCPGRSHEHRRHDIGRGDLLADLPTYALDIATSGLADLGIKLPTIDPALFPTRRPDARPRHRHENHRHRRHENHRHRRGGRCRTPKSSEPRRRGP